MTLTDLGTLADVAQKVDANPLSLFGRFLGLSQDEQQAGVPPWAWCVAAFVAGSALTIKYGPAIARRLDGKAIRAAE